MEAKRDLTENFLIRQLYYPFRTWHQKMAGKPVRPVFLIYSNSIFYLYEYRFKELQHYNSLELVKHKRYCLEDTHTSVEDVQKVLRKIRFNKEPNILILLNVLLIFVNYFILMMWKRTLLQKSIRLMYANLPIIWMRQDI